MHGFATVMQAHACLWEKRTSRGSTSPLLYLTPTPLFITVKDASFLLTRHKCHHISYKPY
jgi:hypothetical protein